MPKPSAKPPKAPKGVMDSVSDGRLATLEAIRTTLARQIDEQTLCRSCAAELKEPPAAKAQLSKELRAVLVEIESLIASEVVVTSAVDEIARRREDRIAAAHVAGSSVRRVRQRVR